ncbi:16S rRNA (guanine527-N7)-methyltransferase [Allopseudospirillum japonicum]|uniref:Ribosomal RNA small subunit methyltransferase G n=1 Tax=Allopseudospirillum japonicum TaxID=64971 RepID=A0A1H6RIA8_9GAMM|nr:16S rRNA (guanine(527)-N(7))-methyltransferase RsmG [Allopseudospirillum japonicum]SEI52257.1 16S rRNA (guanine527-N7)-methyltransferase [Allopseudospirillum japonicum]
MSSRVEQALSTGLNELSLSLSAQQQASLLEYISLLQKWNRTYNLTAVRDPVEMVSKHILDSLSVLKHLDPEQPLLDVGSGAGLPGIPLAICYPNWPISLLDTNGKKSRFQFQACAHLGLTQVAVIHTRVENFQPSILFPQIISRAFSSLQDMLRWTEHLLAEKGTWWAMKGTYPQEELQALDSKYQLLQTCSLQVPQLEGERHLLQLAPS